MIEINRQLIPHGTANTASCLRQSLEGKFSTTRNSSSEYIESSSSGDLVSVAFKNPFVGGSRQFA